jgi:16S rRNA (cytidine1402-2'-O)-methyltransferase
MTTPKKFGKLYLIPTNLADPFTPASILPNNVISIALTLNHYIAENAKTARAFLKVIGISRPLQEISIVELDKHINQADNDSAHALLAPLLAGFDVGLVSEAGAPAVADPGAIVVAAAHEAGIQVVPLVGRLA